MGYGVEKQGGNKSGNLRCCSGGDLCSKCGACPAPLSCCRGSLADPVLQSSPTHGAFSASASLPGTCQGRGCRDALPIKGTQSFWLCLFPPFPLLQALGQEWREHLGQDGEMCQRGKQGKLMQNGMVKFYFKRVFFACCPSDYPSYRSHHQPRLPRVLSLQGIPTNLQSSGGILFSPGPSAQSTAGCEDCCRTQQKTTKFSHL